MSETAKSSDTITDWWRTHLADRDSGRARALAARLRRADAIALLCEPEVQELAKRLGIKPDQAPDLIRLVHVLSHVRSDDARSLARLLGGAPPVMSHLRFQKLLRTRGESLTEALRRALLMADRRCNVRRLGWDLRLWDDPLKGDDVRTRWAFDYFATPLPEEDAPLNGNLEN